LPSTMTHHGSMGSLSSQGSIRDFTFFVGLLGVIHGHGCKSLARMRCVYSGIQNPLATLSMLPSTTSSSPSTESNKLKTIKYGLWSMCFWRSVSEWRVYVIISRCQREPMGFAWGQTSSAPWAVDPVIIDISFSLKHFFLVFFFSSHHTFELHTGLER
jgi:hypothetical protein